jgi:site-specific DNA-cytosine methylase
MRIKEYSNLPQLSLGLEIAGHEIVDSDEELSIFYEKPSNGFPDTPYFYIKHDAQGDKVINIKVFGIPQNRILAWDSNIIDLYHFSYPSPTIKDCLDSISQTPITFYQQFTSTTQGHIVIDVPNTVSDRIKQVPAGGCWVDIPNYDLQNKTFNAYRRLKPYTYAPIMTNVKKDIIIHPIEDRILTPREAGIIQGFPANYELTEDSYQQIADSIPPIIGYHIGMELRGI